MDTTEQTVEGPSLIPNRSRRKTPEEIDGFESVFLIPGGEVDVVNVSNSGILVETGARVKPGSPVQLRVTMTGASQMVDARIVRSEVMTVDGGGLRYELAIAFDETQDLIDWDEASPVVSGEPSALELSTTAPLDDAQLGLLAASSPNRW